MPITRTKKESNVTELIERLSRIEAAVFVHYQGLTVRDFEQLRQNLRDEGIDFRVVKNKIFRLAAKEAGISVEAITGPVGVAFGYTDSVTTAKVVSEFAKKHEPVEIAGGIIDGAEVDAVMIKKLASLPSREELLGRLVGSLSAPTRNLASALSATSRNLVYALKAVQEQKA
jgi:large subunit ribosomal protein L10